jgi:hypothetical protein
MESGELLAVALTIVGALIVEQPGGQVEGRVAGADLGVVLELGEEEVLEQECRLQFRFRPGGHRAGEGENLGIHLRQVQVDVGYRGGGDARGGAQGRRLQDRHLRFDLVGEAAGGEGVDLEGAVVVEAEAVALVRVSTPPTGA